MKLSKETIINLLKASRKGLSQHEINRLIGIDKGRRRRFFEILDELVSSGKVVKKGGAFTLQEGAGRLCGTISVNRRGYGFVILENGEGDVFIPARELRGNLHGDKVCIEIERSEFDGRRSGRIVATLGHGQKRVVGRYTDKAGVGVVIPDDPRVSHQFHVPRNSAGGAISDQMVVAEITSYPTRQQPASARVIEVLGWPEDPETSVLGVIRSFDLPASFSEDTLQEAQNLPSEISQADREGRVDLREILTVTIDGETARDFDDAVAIRSEADGKIRLWVSIADVAHYVRPGSAIDKEALERGTSVYFPDRCLPMLPEKLSNFICSLNPGVERLTMSAEILFDARGTVLQTDFYPSVIVSKARLTYTMVRDMLLNPENMPATGYEYLLPELKSMAGLSEILLQRRKERGSIDFDLPEAEIIIGATGETTDIVKAERNLAHRLIEEFMLAANEAVASFVSSKNIPFIYRIHEPPDPAKFGDFRELAEALGHHLDGGDDVTAKELQQLLVSVEGMPEERMINELLLRSMKQARYSVDNFGHFGLASSCYTHFTSPIRRYPDLVVHRILKKVLAKSVLPADLEKMATELREIAAHTSGRERVAMDAEREVVLLKKLEFMLPKIGEEFSGFIVGVSQYGLFVELADLFVEGMLPIALLPKDRYVYIDKQHALMAQHGNILYRIGDKVEVRLARVDVASRQIEFSLLAHVSIDGRSTAPQIEYPRIPVRGKRPIVNHAKDNATQRGNHPKARQKGGRPRRKR
jgi:ribonuclease R